jgi:hypothetical protein
MTHLFTIDDTVWDSVDTPTVFDTASDLVSMGLFRLPFPTVDVQIHLNEKATRKLLRGDSYCAPRKTLVIRFFTKTDTSDIYDFDVKLQGDREFLSRDEMELRLRRNGVDAQTISNSIKGVEYISKVTLAFFVVLLATKNADKVTESIKKHGPKSRKRPRAYDYITTIKIGKITETMRSDGDGQGSVRPHLRRGHIRNQRVGKGLEEVKPIFISPVFVNADEGWINNQRKEYRIAA